jgi:hypothetical protein
MAHSPSALGSVTYEVESACGELTPTTTGTLRVPNTIPVDTSGLIHHRYPSERVQQYPSGGDKWIKGTMEGEFKTKTWLTGHGSSTAGAGSKSAYETWLGLATGGSSAYVAGTTLTGGTANIPTTTASATHLAGGLTFIGALGDGDGEAQAYAIATHTLQNLTLLSDLRGAPVNGAAMSGGVLFYHPESSSAVTTLRFKLATADYQYLCHGCAPIAYTITGFNAGERPAIEVTWKVAWFEYRAETFPVTTATDVSNPAATAAGSLWVNDVGTTTNVAGAACRTYFSLSFETTVGMEILRGPGGYSPNQDIIGYRRTVPSWKLSWVEAAESATTSPTLPNWETAKHVLCTLSVGDGSRVAFYWPNVCPADPTPVQFSDQNLNRIRFTGMCHTGTTTTNDVTLSPWRMLMA